MKQSTQFDFASHGDRVAMLIRQTIGDPKEFIPLHEPEFSASSWTMVKDCLDSGWVSSVGKYVDQFEYDIAKACSTSHAVAVVNGTAALQVAMMVCGVRHGDEVIVPSLTFVATANAVVHVGAIPHFVDSDAHNFGIGVEALHNHLDRVAVRRGEGLFNQETGRRISAILPMHVFGHPVDMDPLITLADDYGLPVIEDAAEALGSSYKTRPCGSLGRVGILSFNGNKILTTGGGGALVTNDADLAKRAKHLTTTAKVPHRWAFEHDEIAFNYRMPNLNAALGCSQLQELEARVAQKRKLAHRYADAFDDMQSIEFIKEPAGCRSNYWLNTLRLKTEDPEQREQLLGLLNDQKIMARPVWALLHLLPMFTNCPKSKCPVAETLETQLINIPSSAHLARDLYP
jgi:perosamine synthetase